MEEVYVWMVRTSSSYEYCSLHLHVIPEPELRTRSVACSVILLPIAITFYTTWWFIRFVDGFFSPIYVHLGIHLFGN